MNNKIVLYILGKVMMFLALFMLVPFLVAVIYGEKAGVYFLLTAIASLMIGFALSWKKPKDKRFYAREGFVVVSLSWIMISIVGAIPFVVSGEIPNMVDAVFEIVSGFTTTGASILTRVEDLSKCMLMWRSFSHWIGGMGVIVFIMAIIPMAGGSNMHLLRAESSGSNVGKLVPKMKQTAIILYGIYMALTVIMFIALHISGMPVFENLCHTFGTAGTGGFGVVSDSIGSCTNAQQWIITIFMFIFGVNFSFYYLIIFRKIGQALKMEEVRWYFVAYISAVILVVWNVVEVVGNMGDAIRHSAFQVASLMTTTGYSTIDYEVWPSFAKGILLLVMFVGGCAGSTAGGIKISRFVIGFKALAKEVKKLIHPQRVKITKMDGKAISDDTTRMVSIYFLVYIAIYVFSFIIVSIDNFDFETNFTAVAATLNNIGPGFGEVGPTDCFNIFSPISKIVLTIDMLIGRLEIFPMLLLFMPSTWKNK
ncbi:MAG: TrkH family potassium uptake protein [Lachnospiraceae bacterium]|nr:TrkH family potassium uptake protein [Lachnospiraceae bacterium]